MLSALKCTEIFPEKVFFDGNQPSVTVITFKKNGRYLFEAKQLGGSQSVPSGNEKDPGIFLLPEVADDFFAPNDYLNQKTLSHE